jgi:hypothetical protein
MFYKASIYLCAVSPWKRWLPGAYPKMALKKVYNKMTVISTADDKYFAVRHYVPIGFYLDPAF